MKNAKLSYHQDFPQTPVSGWAGVRRYAWVNQQNDSGQWKRPKHKYVYPFEKQRKLWCLLEIHFQGVDLIFALPAELDQFIEIMSQNPLPSGNRLIKGRKLGRPNNHWLSRLPKKTKPWAFRQKLCKYLETAPQASEFREFYTSHPVRLKFDGYYDSFYDAIRAQKMHTSTP
ncbi:hypothetical protein F9L33_07535 [Amylibacter sp. SFDW26]|uniref:hypothetical protein n=1 Tax=Amylibacter sp. SFDW26 TaxID=2652722 RepID=UPI0012622491|nr:hypothetical protein [Amylibacter sp. SFDW26]KAB7614483.1 hypothetical protein F9L33_07535 [Amylibacter sp. SFDW26]